jgi:serine/threonine protein kinase
MKHKPGKLMLDPNPIDTCDELDEAVAAYLLASEEGTIVDRDAWVGQHTQVAAELIGFFDALDSVNRFTKSLRFQATDVPRCEITGYNIEGELGRGGMGIVYRARHHRLNRWVALKVIRARTANSEHELRRFQIEAEAASRLNHPHVVPVYDFGECNGQLYLTMKLIEAGCLATWHDKNCVHSPQSLLPTAMNEQRRVAIIIEKIARAVHHAHRHGILHRDLKPSNILLDEHDEPFVADFGLAKQTWQDSELTQSGAIIGTPSYMAPEQAMPLQIVANPTQPSSASSTTTASDIYGLGAILYFMLTRQPPFRGDSVFATLSLVRSGQIVSPLQINPAIDRDLAAICRKCLERLPKQRYDSAELLAEELRNWLDGKPLIARPPTLFETGMRWCHQNQLLVFLLSAMAVSLVVGFSALSVGLISANRSRDDAMAQRRTALANLRTVVQEINDLENRRPDLEQTRLELLTRIQKQLQPMLDDPVHGSLADETNFWLEIDAGDLEENQGNVDAACERFLKAMSIVQRIPRDQDGKQQRMYSFALSHLGDAENQKLRRQSACEYFTRCIEVRRQLVKQHPSSQATADLALSLLKLATTQLWLHDENHDVLLPTSAIELCEEAIGIYKNLNEVEPAVVWHGRFLAYAREEIAIANHRLKKWDIALKHCQLGLDDVNAAKKRMPDYKLILDTHGCILRDVYASVCWDCGRFQAGVEASKEAFETRQKIAELSSGVVFLQHSVMWSLQHLGQNLHGLGRIQEAEQALSDAIQIGQRLSHQSHDVKLTSNLCRDILIASLIGHSEFDSRMIELYHQQLDVLEAAAKEEPDNREANLSIFQRTLQFADCYLLRGDFDDAERLYLRAEKLLESPKRPAEFETAQQAMNGRISLRSMKDREEIAAELSVISKATLILERLQNHYRGLNDFEMLATVSKRLYEESEHFLTKWLAFQGLTEAIHHLSEGDHREEILKCLAEVKADMLTFGDHVPEMISAGVQPLGAR